MASTAADQSSPQVVFIDGDVPDLQDLLSGLAPGVEAFVLDPSSDGLQQIADILATNNLGNVSSISIVGHGASGQIQVGSTTLDAGDLSSESAELEQIGAALAPGGDLQLYSCDTASGASGQQFIADLSSFIGAPVAASTQDIGQTSTGENWTLDATSGPALLQTANPFTSAAEASFSGTLSVSDTELWFSGSQGSDENLIIHGDDTGTSSATNVNTLFTPVSANQPNPANFSVLRLLTLDTQNNVYVVATENAGARLRATSMSEICPRFSPIQLPHQHSHRFSTTPPTAAPALRSPASRPIRTTARSTSPITSRWKRSVRPGLGLPSSAARRTSWTEPPTSLWTASRSTCRITSRISPAKRPP